MIKVNKKDYRIHSIEIYVFGNYIIKIKLNYPISSTALPLLPHQSPLSSLLNSLSHPSKSHSPNLFSHPAKSPSPNLFSHPFKSPSPNLFPHLSPLMHTEQVRFYYGIVTTLLHKRPSLFTFCFLIYVILMTLIECVTKCAVSSHCH